MGHHRHSQSSRTRQLNEGESLGGRHHNFTIELFLDEMGEASDIFIDHGQSGEKEKLTSWEPERLIDFIIRHTGLPAAKLAPEEPSSHRKHTSKTLTTSSLPEPAQTPGHVPPSTSSSEIAGAPHLRDLKVVSIDSETPTYVLHQGQPFRVRLTLDLSEVIAPRKMPFVYEATIIARQPGGTDQIVGEARKRIEAPKSTVISVASTGLPQGMYHLDALVRLSPAETENERQASAVTYLESDLLEVY